MFQTNTSRSNKIINYQSYATRRRPLIFQIMNSIRSKSQSLIHPKFQAKDIGLEH